MKKRGGSRNRNVSRPRRGPMSLQLKGALQVFLLKLEEIPDDKFESYQQILMKEKMRRYYEKHPKEKAAIEEFERSLERKKKSIKKGDSSRNKNVVETAIASKADEHVSRTQMSLPLTVALEILEEKLEEISDAKLEELKEKLSEDGMRRYWEKHPEEKAKLEEYERTRHYGWYERFER